MLNIAVCGSNGKMGQKVVKAIKDANDMIEEELEQLGYNKSKNHVDMMIGTKDLNITAKTFDNKEIQIFKDGSFNI